LKKLPKVTKKEKLVENPREKPKKVTF